MQHKEAKIETVKLAIDEFETQIMMHSHHLMSETSMNTIEKVERQIARLSHWLILELLAIDEMESALKEWCNPCDNYTLCYTIEGII